MSLEVGWPVDAEELVTLQGRLAALDPPVWEPGRTVRVGASYCCFARGSTGAGAAGEPGWSGAARKEPGRQAATAVARGTAGWAYVPGLLALREGRLREAALRRLPELPDVMLVDATGRDHPRGAGLALHLGAGLDVPTIGVTDCPLAARADEPGEARGATAPLRLRGSLVGYLVRTRPGARPVFVHAAWRTDPDVAAEIVLGAARRARTPQPLREARRAARDARGQAGG